MQAVRALGLRARGQERRPRWDVERAPTRTQVEAFSAAGTSSRRSISPPSRVCRRRPRARREYAEWRAWDLATAMHAGRQPSPVNGHGHGHGGGSSPKETSPGTEARSRAAGRVRRAAVSPDRVCRVSRHLAAAAASLRRAVAAAAAAPARSPVARHGTPVAADVGGSAVGAAVGQPGAPHRENDRVLYREREGGYKLARVLKVDTSVDPPGYVVEVDGAERSTEAGRLAPAPKPRRRSDGGKNRDGVGSGSIGASGNGSDSDGCVDASAAFAPPSRSGCRGGADGVPSDAYVPSRSDMALAHEFAMEAAQCLDPSRGDHEGALEFLRRATDALERRR